MCKTIFTSRQGLKRHIVATHEGKKPFICDMCEATFARADHLKVHISTVHEGSKAHKCEKVV